MRSRAGAGLRSLAEPWADTTTPAGRMVLTVFADMADFERSLIVERTSAGRIAAKARGVRFGPRPTLGAEQITDARQLIEAEGKPVAGVARLLGVHRATLTGPWRQTNSIIREMSSDLETPSL